MKYLCPFFCVLILAGCGQASVDVTQTKTESDASTSVPPADPIEIPARKSTPSQHTEAGKTQDPIPSAPVPATTLPPKEVSNPANPEKGTPSEPKEVSPPSEEELSPAELIARKLISHDPGDNLEVLNEALKRWLTNRDALPERVGDLVNEQFLPMLPMAPAGKVFAIDAENRRVILIAEEK